MAGFDSEGCGQFFEVLQVIPLLVLRSIMNAFQACKRGWREFGKEGETQHVPMMVPNYIARIRANKNKNKNHPNNRPCPKTVSHFSEWGYYPPCVE